MKKSILIISDPIEYESGFARVANDLTIMLKKHIEHQYNIIYLHDAPQGSLDDKFTFWEKQYNIDIVISIQDVWNQEWIAKRHNEQNWIWIGYIPIEAERLYPEVIIGNRCINIYSILYQMDMIICYNEFGINQFYNIRDTNGFIYHGIDNSKFYFDKDLYKLAKKKSNEIIVGFIGKNIPRKGIDLLVYEWQSGTLKHRIENIYMGKKAHLVIHTMDTGLSPNIDHLIYEDTITVYKNSFDDQDLLEFYHYIDLYITLHNAEGFGLPVLEAFSCGCPVISTNYAGPAEICRNIYDSDIIDMLLIPTDGIVQDVGIPWIRKIPALQLWNYNEQILQNRLFHNSIDDAINTRISISKKAHEIYSWDIIIRKWIDIINSAAKQNHIVKAII